MELNQEQQDKLIPLKLTKPEEIMKFGKILNRYIKDNKLSTEIGGKQYAFVDGWKFALLNFQLMPIASDPIRKDSGLVVYSHWNYVKKKKKNGEWYETLDATLVTLNKEIEQEEAKNKPPIKRQIRDYFYYECSCDILHVKTKEKLGQGFALCTNAETSKVNFDLYAVASMSQTRAIAKASRNLLGFIMNAAGFEGTPAEEMEGVTIEEDKKVAEKSPDDWQLAIDSCGTIPELTKLWDENPGIHKDNVLIAKFGLRKAIINQPKK